MSIAVFERRSAERQALEVKARTESEAQTAKLTNERDQQWREIGAIAATVVTAAAAVKVDVIYSVAPQSKVLTDVENVGTPALADLDVDALSPREALEQLYRLKALAGE